MTGRAFPKKVAYLVFAAVLVVLVAVLAIMFTARPKIPPGIMKQVSFVVKHPAASWEVDHDSIKYDPGSHVLTFTAKQGDKSLVISQQATPDPFKDIPGYMGKVTEQMKEYSSFDSASGEVHLTRPETAGGVQVAVANSQGTLMFVRANSDLTDDQWRKFFNSLDPIK